MSAARECKFSLIVRCTVLRIFRQVLFWAGNCGSTVIDEKCQQTYLTSNTLKQVGRHGKRHNKSVDMKSPTCQHPTLEFNKAYPLLTRLSLVTAVRSSPGESPNSQDTPWRSQQTGSRQAPPNPIGQHTRKEVKI